MSHRRWGIGLIVLVLALAWPARAWADGPVLPSYLLDGKGRRVPAPAAYIYSGYLGGETQARGMFDDPQDLFRVAETGELVVADTGHDRVVVLDETGQVRLEIGGEAAGLNAPTGVFVDPKGNIWVADSGNARVALFAPDGHLLATYGKPDSRYLAGRDFSPTKIVVDRRGFIYLVTGREGDLGVVVMDTQEHFRGFFGRTRVRTTLARVLARLVATKAQRRRMLRLRPAPLGNLHLDAQGFVYAVSPVLKHNQIQRLNSVGENVYGGAIVGSGIAQLTARLRGHTGPSFGESRVQWRWDSRWDMMVPYRVSSIFVDVAVDDLGTVSALDQYTYQVYQYDQAGHLVAILGGRGQREGYLVRPTSLAAGAEGVLYVLDAGRGNIQVFRPTASMRQVHCASYAYYDGRYAEAASLWAEIAQHNSNFALAHVGLGKALMQQGDFAGAMREYRYAEDREGYSAAFREYRYHWLRDHFTPVGLGTIGLVATLNVLSAPLGRWRKRVVKSLRRRRERGDGWPVPVLLLLAVVVRVASLSALGFHFRTQRPEETHFLIESGKVLLPWITWCVAALAVSEIFYGEGTLRQIVVSSAWALWPFILFALPLSLLTRWLTLDEAALVQAGWWLIGLLVAGQFFQQVRTIHHFETGQALAVLVLTLLGMVVIWVLLGLVYALSAEIVRFIGSLALEIYVRRF